MSFSPTGSRDYLKKGKVSCIGLTCAKTTDEVCTLHAFLISFTCSFYGILIQPRVEAHVHVHNETATSQI